ncbi:MAG: YkvA family protein [Anaerolineales bacterium]|nr:YkvA family protein [Anaerolineales bacterium]
MKAYWTNWKNRARRLGVEVYALYLAYRDPRVPWYARLWAMVVVGYAFSPIDLIPDPIPILGHLDDLVLIPLGVALALRLIPAPVLAECRARSQTAFAQGKPVSRAAAFVIVLIWLLLAALAARLLFDFLPLRFA